MARHTIPDHAGCDPQDKENKEDHFNSGLSD